MKSLHKYLILALLCLFLLDCNKSSFTESTDPDPIVVTFSDTNFERRIRELVNKPSGDVTDIDLAKLTQLYAFNESIRNIVGIEYCTNLEHIDLVANRISDIYPLVQNQGLGSGDKVIISNNPLSSTSLNNYIPTLEARGVNVIN